MIYRSCPYSGRTWHYCGTTNTLRTTYSLPNIQRLSFMNVLTEYSMTDGSKITTYWIHRVELVTDRIYGSKMVALSASL